MNFKIAIVKKDLLFSKIINHLYTFCFYYGIEDNCGIEN